MAMHLKTVHVFYTTFINKTESLICLSSLYQACPLLIYLKRLQVHTLSGHTQGLQGQLTQEYKFKINNSMTSVKLIEMVELRRGFDLVSICFLRFLKNEAVTLTRIMGPEWSGGQECVQVWTGQCPCFLGLHKVLWSLNVKRRAVILCKRGRYIGWMVIKACGFYSWKAAM